MGIKREYAEPQPPLTGVDVTQSDGFGVRITRSPEWSIGPFTIEVHGGGGEVPNFVPVFQEQLLRDLRDGIDILLEEEDA